MNIGIIRRVPRVETIEILSASIVASQKDTTCTVVPRPIRMI